MSKEATNATTALANPGTGHNLEERRAVTADVLKLTGHELKKNLTDRVSKAKETRQKCYEDLGDYMHAFNVAAESCWGQITAGLKDDFRHSFVAMNRLAGEDDEEFDVQLEVNDKAILFGLQGMERDGYYHQGESALSQMRDEILKDEDAAAKDLVVPLTITVTRGSYTEMNVERNVEVTATTALQDARTDLVKASEPFYAAVAALKKAEKDLSDLPSNMEELEMQATARRIQDMGGEDVLRSVLASAGAVLDGESVSGLAAALPEASSLREKKGKEEG